MAKRGRSLRTYKRKWTCTWRLQEIMRREWWTDAASLTNLEVSKKDLYTNIQRFNSNGGLPWENVWKQVPRVSLNYMREVGYVEYTSFVENWWNYWCLNIGTDTPISLRWSSLRGHAHLRLSLLELYNPAVEFSWLLFSIFLKEAVKL